ncbi:MAG TPA: hypothetical protein VMW64_04570, partial [Dehalococcoidia bacterium]|nr:hypothetical protein [Dehalococcoidia bacterium]
MLDLFTIVWGEMADSYLEFTLPSMLQEGNIPAARESIGSYTFYASDEAKSVITADRLYPQLEKLVPILWQPLQKGEWELNSNILSQMKASASMKNYILPLPPDVTLGNKSLLNLTGLINQNFNPILYSIPRITEEGCEALKSLLKAQEVVSNREMVSLAMKYFWKRAYPIVDRGDHWEVSCPLPAPCFLPDAELIDYFSQDTTLTGYNIDHCLPYTMVERGYPWHLINHSDIFFGVERKTQILTKKVSELGIWRPEREEDIIKTRQAEEFFVRQSVQTWQGFERSKPQDFI